MSARTRSGPAVRRRWAVGLTGLVLAAAAAMPSGVAAASSSGVSGSARAGQPLANCEMVVDSNWRTDPHSPLKIGDRIELAPAEFLKRFPNAIKQDWSPLFKMELGEKDVSLALSFARDLKRPMPTTSMIHQMMLTALATGYAGLDIVAMLDMYQSMNGARSA